MILTVLNRVQKVDEKNMVTTPEIIRKGKARFDRNPRHSGRKIARELNISRELMHHILKNDFGLKPLKFQKVQELTDGQKKLDWKEPRIYFACTKGASYRIWFSPMGSHFKLSSF